MPYGVDVLKEKGIYHPISTIDKEGNKLITIVDEEGFQNGMCSCFVDSAVLLS